MIDEPQNAIEKALRLLSVVANSSEERPVAVKDILPKVGMTRPTTHRMLNSLVKYHLVEQDPESGGYRLGSGVMALASRMKGTLKLQDRARPLLVDLAEETGVTTHFGIRDGDRVVYVEKIESREPIRLASAVGQAAAMHSSGIGKALLAFCEDKIVERYLANDLERRTEKTIVGKKALWAEIRKIRTAGYAVDDEENEPGIRCVAAPIFDYNARVIASLSIAGTTSQVPKKDVSRLARCVKETANAISSLMGYSP